MHAVCALAQAAIGDFCAFFARDAFAGDVLAIIRLTLSAEHNILAYATRLAEFGIPTYYRRVDIAYVALSTRAVVHSCEAFLALVTPARAMLAIHAITYPA